MRVRISRVDPSIPLPRYETPGAAAFDLCARLTCTVDPRAVERVPANVVIEVPEGFSLVVALRSSTPARYGLIHPHGIGIVDRDFCGPDDEIAVQVYNPGDEPITVERGARIAQALLVPVMTCDWEEADVSGRASRGGFGSTGHHTDVSHHPAAVDELHGEQGQ